MAYQKHIKIKKYKTDHKYRSPYGIIPKDHEFMGYDEEKEMLIYKRKKKSKK